MDLNSYYNHILETLDYKHDLDGIEFKKDEIKIHIDTDYCVCGGRIILHDEYVCIECGLVQGQNLIFNPFDSYSTSSRYMYSRHVHFKKWLARFTLIKSFLKIPQLEKIRLLLKPGFDADNVKDVLKKLKLQKYYKNIVTIMYMLGETPPALTPEICQMFINKFKVFEFKFNELECDRKNLLSYSLLLDQFSQELNIDLTRFLHRVRNKKCRKLQLAIYNLVVL